MLMQSLLRVAEKEPMLALSLGAFVVCFVLLVVCVTVAQIAWWALAPRERLIADGRVDDDEDDDDDPGRCPKCGRSL
jgi:hypothetical protein